MELNIHNLKFIQGLLSLKENDDVLVGVASFVAAADADQNLMEKCKTEGQRDCWTRETVCGKDANNGKQWPYQLSGYVDVFEYADWIKGKINGGKYLVNQDSSYC